jgi:hypothetical protein
MRVPRARRGAAPARLVLLACLLASLLLPQLPARALPVPDTPTPVTGNATWFEALGSPYGGCGLPQSELDSQDFVALNVYDTPADYSFYPRPLPPSLASKIGMWNNGHNCGRWVQVTISDFCTGINDGAPNQPFCRNGSFVGDAYNGATLTMLVADSCGDANAWCRDDPYHLDLARASLNRFVKGGVPVGDMYPDHWNNRHVTWSFVPAPNYGGDIQIGFLQGAQSWWGAIAVSHLPNGIHGVEYLSGDAWQQAQMDGDMGQAFVVLPTTPGGTQFQVRVRDVTDALVNNGRVYSFSLPAACSPQCGAAYTRIAYTTSDQATTTTQPTGTTVPTTTTTPTSTTLTGRTCSATYRTVSSWQGGSQGEVTVTNNGATTSTGWVVTISNPTGQSITQLWNGSLSVSGSTATVRNLSYNGTLAPGAATTFGFTASAPDVPVPPPLTCAAT